MPKVNEQALYDYLTREVEHPFDGWDFSYLSETGRLTMSLLKWCYASRIIPEMRQCQSMLDMGTGGGEFLSYLQPLPPRTFATEGYAPNVEVAKDRLEPLGVTVVPINSDNLLPFDDNTFDLIINRHESYSVKEVKRTLRKSRKFITQQVGGDDCIELNNLLKAPLPYSVDWNLKRAVDELQANGFEIVTAMEDFPVSRFYDIGAVVYYLKVIVWQFEDFSVDKYFDRLVEISNMINKNSFLDIKSSRFFIEAVLK